MSKHQKRLSVPDSWPVERKTATFTVKADAGPHGEGGVPLLILLRDVLGYVDSRKEARYALNQGSVLVNGEPLDDEERPIGMFDIVEFEQRDEHYRVFPDEGGRLALSPIDADDADSKLGKIAGKGQVPGGATQLALHDGHTLEVDSEEYAGGDSIVVDHDNGVLAHFPYEEGALVTAVRGQHAGEVGEIDEIQVTPGSSPNNVRVSQDESDGFETIAEYVVVIDENFVGSESEETVTTTGEGADAAEDPTDDASDEADAEGGAGE
jgi:small subunit ribosomal protein S4e